MFPNNMTKFELKRPQKILLIDIFKILVKSINIFKKNIYMIRRQDTLVILFLYI